MTVTRSRGRESRTRTRLGAVVAAAALAVSLTAVSAGRAEAAAPSLELVGQWGGDSRAVVVSGTTAYVSVGPSVHVYDASTPASPAWIGQIRLPATVLGLAVSGSYLYAATGTAGLQVVDISVPAAPVPAGSYDTAGTANDVAVSGDFAYVADHDKGLVVVNVADKHAPALAGSYDTPGNAYGVAVAGTHAYIADWNGVQIIDVSDKASPSLTWGGNPNMGEYFQDVTVSGTCAYFAVSTAGLHPVDVADPANPVFAEFVTHYEGGYSWAANAVHVSGNRAYVGMYGLLMGGRAAVFDLTDPLAPVYLGAAGTGTDNYSQGVVGVAVAGSSYYAVDSFNGLHVFDAATPAAMVQTSSYYTANYVNDVVTDGTHAYLATGNGWIPTIEFDGTAPRLGGQVQTPADHDIFFLTTDGTRLYASERTSGLGVYDIADPEHVTRTGGAAVAGNTPMGLAVRDQRAFVGTYDHGLQVFDVSDPAAPGSVVDVMGYERVEDVALQGNYAYIPGGNLGLRVVDVTDPASPSVVATLGVGGWAYGIAVSGNRAYVGINAQKLAVVDITDPAAPWLMGSATIATSAVKDVLVLDATHVLVAAYWDGVALVDVADPAAPVKVATYDTAGHATNLARLGNRVLVADSDGGLAVFSLTIPAEAHAVDDAAATKEGHAVDVDVLANDTGEGALAVSAVADPPHGTAGTDGAKVTYTPDAGWSGTDSFIYTMLDSVGGTSDAAVTVTVAPLPVLRKTSSGSQDGWVLEAAEGAGTGGALNAGAATILVGDDAQDRQYRGVLSFNTAGLPDDAVIVSATLKVKRQSILGANPFKTHGALLVDVAKGAFSGSAALQPADFQARATKPAALSVPGTLAGGWYAAAFGPKGLAAINKAGLTQLRLRFAKSDNDDRGGDCLSLFGGNAPAASRPVLEVKYDLP